MRVSSSLGSYWVTYSPLPCRTTAYIRAASYYGNGTSVVQEMPSFGVLHKYLGSREIYPPRYEALVEVVVVVVIKIEIAISSR